MTALDLLRQRGPMPAEHIAAVLQVPEVDVYTELVRAYDKGAVRINPGREWEAMDEVSA